jgi:hypothetical protein
VPNLLRKRTIAPPGAIVHYLARRTKAHVHPHLRPYQHSSANVRPPLGDRSPSRETVSHDLFRSLFPLSPITFTTMLHLIVLGWSINFFQDMCFWIQVWGYDIPTSAHSGILYPSPHFSVLYIHWGQCMIQVWGYERHIYTHLSCF